MEKELINEFQDATENLIRILSPLTEQQLNKTPFPESWTAGQVGDHLLKSYSSWTIFNGKTAIANRPIEEFCKPLSTIFLNFDVKLKAEPTDFNYSTTEFIQKISYLTKLRQQLITLSVFQIKTSLAYYA